MKNTLHTTRKKLRAGTALQALALIGAGASITAVASAPAAAQDYTTGILVGTVQDSAGVPATGGDVTVTSNQQGFTRTTTFGSDGRFRVPQLPTGTYTVTITTASGAVITDQAVRIAANTANTYVFTTAVAGDEILVTGTAERTNDAPCSTLVMGQSPVSRPLTALGAEPDACRCGLVLADAPRFQVSLPAFRPTSTLRRPTHRAPTFSATRPLRISTTLAAAPLRPVESRRSARP